MLADGSPGAERHSPHCARRAANQETKIDGNPEHQIEKAGCISDLGLRNYIDIQMASFP